MNAITLSSDVFLSIEIVSLPVGGMITRIACGSTIFRIVCRRVIPSDIAASVCPSGTEMIPARTISAMYAPSLRLSASSPAPNVVMMLFACAWMIDGPNGTPSEMVG